MFQKCGTNFGLTTHREIQMWYVEVTHADNQRVRYEGLTRDQAADVHKTEYVKGAPKVVSGRMGS